MLNSYSYGLNRLLKQFKKSEIKDIRSVDLLIHSLEDEIT
jgi:hypothetical protein